MNARIAIKASQLFSSLPFDAYFLGSRSAGE